MKNTIRVRYLRGALENAVLANSKDSKVVDAFLNSISDMTDKDEIRLDEIIHMLLADARDIFKEEK